MNTKILGLIALGFVIVIPLWFILSRISQEATFNIAEPTAISQTPEPIWPLRAIDTVKYSRDIAREKSKDASFSAEIDLQIKNIADTGASHVAIGTPYDEEFLPFLRQWVTSARKHRLKVMFRGNLSGWEGWFEYKDITREQHIAGIENFILKNQDLFQDGDIFSSCTECENGGPGDPRMNGDVKGHREFLIKEYNMMKRTFKKINKDVDANYFSMNGDVARLVMDKETTKALDGLIVIDHYVDSVEQLDEDITEMAEDSGGKVVLGEWGAPIPDINGKMTEAEQAAWIADAFKVLEKNDNLVGINYWTHMGSSTQLWNDDNVARPVVEVLKIYYSKMVIKKPL